MARVSAEKIRPEPVYKRSPDNTTLGAREPPPGPKPCSCNSTPASVTRSRAKTEKVETYASVGVRPGSRTLKVVAEGMTGVLVRRTPAS